MQCPDAVYAHQHYEQPPVVGLIHPYSGSEPFCSWLIVLITIRIMATKNPKAVLDMIVKADDVKDVMLLRKAAAAFTSITVKGYMGSRFSFVNRLTSDLQKGSLPQDCQTQVKDSMEHWKASVAAFEAFSAKEDEWTVEAGISMTNVLLNLAAELDNAHTAVSQVWETVKKSRKLELAAATKLKNTLAKASNVAVKPFIKNGVDGAWKGMLFQLQLVTTGHVNQVGASQPAVEESATSVDWSKLHHLLTIEAELGDKQGHR